MQNDACPGTKLNLNVELTIYDDADPQQVAGEILRSLMDFGGLVGGLFSVDGCEVASVQGLEEFFAAKALTL